MDLSRELVFIYVIGFVINLYLIFLIDVQISDMIGLFSPGEQTGTRMASLDGAAVAN
jgi:hypothetical protein